VPIQNRKKNIHLCEAEREESIFESTLKGGERGQKYAKTSRDRGSGRPGVDLGEKGEDRN